MLAAAEPALPVKEAANSCLAPGSSGGLHPLPLARPVGCIPCPWLARWAASLAGIVSPLPLTATCCHQSANVSTQFHVLFAPVSQQSCLMQGPDLWGTRLPSAPPRSVVLELSEPRLVYSPPQFASKSKGLPRITSELASRFLWDIKS